MIEKNTNKLQRKEKNTKKIIENKQRSQFKKFAQI